MRSQRRSSASRPSRRTAGGRKPPESVEAYLASVPADVRSALAKLRQVIRSAAPRAIEVISYQIPTFKLDGRGLVAFAASSGHCTFHLMSTEVVRTHAAALAGQELGRGSIRFAPEQGLPAALVRKLVHARIAENQAATERSRKA